MVKLSRLSRRDPQVDPDAAVAVWSGLVSKAPDLSTAALQGHLKQADRLRSVLDRFAQIAEPRLANDVLIEVPETLAGQIEWSGRPAFWLGEASPRALVAPESGIELGEGVKLFHDCPRREIALRQHVNRMAPSRAAYGLSLDVMGFEGSYLSLVLDLPSAALTELGQSHVLSVNFDFQADRDLGIFVRLNLKCGPNTVNMLREVPRDGSGHAVEFDLAYLDMDASRLESGWIDVMFEAPQYLGLDLRDVMLFRSRRAEV